MKVLRGVNLCRIEEGPSSVIVKPRSERQLRPIYTPQVISSSEDIYQIRDNNYIKSFGVTKSYNNYEESRITCLQYGMRLLKVSYKPNKKLKAGKLEIKILFESPV